jgi:hypothetical protein
MRGRRGAAASAARRWNSRDPRAKPLCHGANRDRRNLNPTLTDKILSHLGDKFAPIFPGVYPSLLQIEALNLAAPQKLYEKRGPNKTGEGPHEFGCHSNLPA